MQHLLYVVVSTSLFVLCQSKINFSGEENATNLLDIASDFMNKSRYFCPDCSDIESNCGNGLKSLKCFEIATNLISKAREILPECPEKICQVPDCPTAPTCSENVCPDVPACQQTTCPSPQACPETTCPSPQACPETTCPDPTPCPEQECPVKYAKPVDCSEVLQLGEKKSGEYAIWPKKLSEPLIVYCDMDTDGGGWTVIQRRGKYSTPQDYFFKDWESYKLGFGNVSEEFWLGNDNIYAISNQAKTTIRYDLEDVKGVTRYAQYDSFRIEDEKKSYTIRIKDYKGDAGDAMLKHNNMKFSTKDRDNDVGPYSCAQDRKGAGWYFYCAEENLNGLYQPGKDASTSNNWRKFRDYVGMAKSEMKLRPFRV